ncbi:FAD-dependent oxidoreductase [Nucisporomicrobium flavum]|uniref:FAD-dependent oxidoreductase n=1 Tax=Nucisporomicrobium flavum TaxID=2785915 RepID=UPI003C2E749C
MDDETDVCVVGGGPAGMTLALLLARSGIHVTVVERSPTLNREYRGEILQPGGIRVLDELGALDGARARGSFPLARFRLVEHGRDLMCFEYGRLPGPHNYLLSLPQAHLLAELRDRCAEYPHFKYIVGRVNELVERDGVVRGVRTADRDGASYTVSARCVVGADGRHSQVRRLAGIPDGRLDIFDQDVAWFRLPNEKPLGEVTVNRAGGNPVLAYDSHPGHAQLGWTLPKGAWRELASAGIGEIRDRVRQAVPRFADRVDGSLRSLADVSLLDVFGACAPRWYSDSLVLIGDAAHTHGPLGAQGINVALQDAVVLHPILVAALRDGDTSAARLAEFDRRRRPDVQAILKFQAIQSKVMLSSGGVAAFVRPKLARVMMRTPIGAKFTRQVAFGNPSVRIAGDLFTASRKASR